MKRHVQIKRHPCVAIPQVASLLAPTSSSTSSSASSSSSSATSLPPSHPPSNMPTSSSTELALAAVATGAAGLFAGGAFYITTVQHPALLSCATSNAFRAAYFKSMFAIVAPLQATLTAISGSAAIATGVLQRHRGGDVLLSSPSTVWLTTGSAMIAIIPYTMTRMMALNKKLIDTDYCIKQGDKWMSESFARWGKLHSVRTSISMAALAGMVLALSGALDKSGVPVARA